MSDTIEKQDVINFASTRVTVTPVILSDSEEFVIAVEGKDAKLCSFLDCVCLLTALHTRKSISSIFLTSRQKREFRRGLQLFCLNVHINLFI